MEPGGPGSFQAVKLQRPARATVCSHSTRDMAAVISIESEWEHNDAQCECLSGCGQIRAERPLLAGLVYARLGLGSISRISLNLLFRGDRVCPRLYRSRLTLVLNRTRDFTKDRTEAVGTLRAFD